MPGNLIAREIGANLFNVDADLTVARDGVKSQPVGVCEVKTKSARSFMTCKRRLAVCVRGESELGRVLFQIGGEDAAEHSARDDERGAICLEMKALSATDLIRGEERP